jgi:hypothetical protein
MSSRGHTSTQLAGHGTEWPSGRGKCPVTGMGGSPCGSGSPSPGYLVQSGSSMNWGVGMTMFLACFACCRAKALVANRISVFRALLTTARGTPLLLFRAWPPSHAMGAHCREPAFCASYLKILCCLGPSTRPRQKAPIPSLGHHFPILGALTCPDWACHWRSCLVDR